MNIKISNLKSKKAFTIIEIIVVVGLISAVSLLVTMLLTQSFKSYRIKKQSIELEEKAATVMREFERSTRAATKINYASSSELNFFRFFDFESSSPSQVRYFQEDGKFKVGITGPSGSEPNVTYPVSDEKITLIIDDLQNADSIFAYYDDSGNQLAEPFNLSDIKMIGLVIELDKNGDEPPAPMSETTKVNLRNMKDNL